MKEVYFLSSTHDRNRSLLKRFRKLLNELNPDFIKQDEQVLIKTHFGEEGNTTFLSPLFIRETSEFIISKSAYPFVGDTLTLYKGDRKKAVTHHNLAIRHGFDYANVKAPIVILDGIKGDYYYKMQISGKHFKEVQLAGGFVSADSVIVLTHVKGHGNTGMGGAIKNLSMGLATRAQKQRMHADVKPKVIYEKCVLCDECIKICPENAVENVSDKIHVKLDSCIGCAECITHCPTGAMQVLWNESSQNISEKMAETAHAAVLSKRGKMFFVNFLINITPDCDCFGYSGNPIVNNIGVLLSEDPVAVDKASYDLINLQKPLPGSVLENTNGKIFDCLHSGTDPLRQLTYSEELKTGTMNYKLIEC